MKASYSPTMDQIAKELGVSVSTVSRVINCRESRISAATKARVIEAAARLGYSPNFMASSLSRGQGSRTIGICVSLYGDFYSDLVDSMIEAMGPFGYTGMVMPARNGGPGEQDVFRAFVTRRVEGVIMRPSSYDVKADYFKELESRGLPIVMVDVELHTLKMPFCGTDDYSGAMNAAKHLLSLGHRVLGHVAGDQVVTTGLLRKKAFLDAVSAAGAKAVLCKRESYTADDSAIEEMLTANPRPTAVFAANDDLAVHVYKVAAKLGLRIPEDLSVVGFANMSFAEILSPPLSTLNQQPRLIGRNAVESLLALIEKKDGASNALRRLVTPAFVHRASTAKPRQS